MSAEALPIEIRAMLPSDIDAVCRIAESVPQAPHWPRNVYATAVDAKRRPARIALVAESMQQAVVAYCIAVVIPSQAELETIAVAAEHQRRGIARRLVSTLLVKLKEISVTEVMLEVRESNSAARGFYAALGFAEAGRRPRYYADPEEDALLLTLSVG
jgi:ribosomal-protein-alanine N-acetyltransferase